MFKRKKLEKPIYWNRIQWEKKNLYREDINRNIDEVDWVRERERINKCTSGVLRG